MADRWQILVAALAVITALGAQAEGSKVYRWVDDQGVVHFGDSVPPEHAVHDRAVLNEYGIAVETEEGAMTAEERAEKQAAQQAADAIKKRHECHPAPATKPCSTPTSACRKSSRCAIVARKCSMARFITPRCTWTRCATSWNACRSTPPASGPTAQTPTPRRFTRTWPQSCLTPSIPSFATKGRWQRRAIARCSWWRNSTTISTASRN